MAGTSKQTRGRQKIEMKRIEDDEDRLVTFSKRRSGIYKKASELVAMCGVEVGLFIFSPTGKAFSFAHPSIQSITDRFLNRNANQPAVVDEVQALIDSHRKTMMDRQTQHLNSLLSRLDEAKQRGKALGRMTQATMEEARAKGEPGWWERSTDDLSPDELKQQIASIEASYRDLCNYLNHPVNLAALGTANPAPDPLAPNDPADEAEARAGPSGENING